MVVTLEFDCPVDGIDYDHEVEFVDAMRPFHCPGCAGTHTAGKDVAVNVLMADGTILIAVAKGAP